MHLVNWDQVCRSKQFGGLGIKRLLEHNTALLAKWWWRYNKDSDTLWVKIIKSKYGDLDTWKPILPDHGKISNIWKDICNIGNLETTIGEIISQGFKIKVNSGNSTKFWSHTWIGDHNLECSFPRLFLLSTQKESLISDLLTPEANWNLQFRRALFEWELEQLKNLMLILDGVSINNFRDDCLTWSWNPNLIFSVTSIYKQWEKQTFQENSILNCIWRNLCPAKIELFAWLALQKKIASRSILARYNIITFSQKFCPMCTDSEESPQHLLLHCSFAWKIWSSILRWWRFNWVCPPDLAALSQI